MQNEKDEWPDRKPERKTASSMQVNEEAFGQMRRAVRRTASYSQAHGANKLSPPMRVDRRFRINRK